MHRRLVLVPKQINNPFFDVVKEGCEEEAHRVTNRQTQLQTDGSTSQVLSVECVYLGPTVADPSLQAEVIDQIVAQHVNNTAPCDGLALSATVAGDAVLQASVASAAQAGIPVVTFDSDDSDMDREVFIGTNNNAFGQTLGKILLQIEPQGGTYGVISSDGENIAERLHGLMSRLGTVPAWEQVGVVNCNDNISLAVEQTRSFVVDDNVSAVIPLGGWPMFHLDGAAWEDMADNLFPKDLVTVVADTLPGQMDLLNKDKVNGLVGQVPYKMGVEVVDYFADYHVSGGHLPTVEGDTILGTVLHEVVTVPLDRPVADIDHNKIGHWRMVGFTMAALLICFSLFSLGWTYHKRNHRIVRASQPIFLATVSVGAVIMSSSLLLLSSVNELTSEEDLKTLLDQNKCTDSGIGTCTGPVWLLSVGFCIMFAALFSKTWRINKIFFNPSSFARIQIKARDVLWPFAVLLFLNVVVLSLMTVYAPLKYIRAQDLTATDEWNRVISTYGECRSTASNGGARVYMFALFLINIGVLVVANCQAYQARSIQSEFSESRYIGIAMASMLQTVVIVGPVLMLTERASLIVYIVRVCAIFLITGGTMLCVFAPKFAAVQKFENENSALFTTAQDVPQRISFVAHNTSNVFSANSNGTTLDNCNNERMGLSFSVGAHSLPRNSLSEPKTRAPETARQTTPAVQLPTTYETENQPNDTPLSIATSEEELIQIARNNLPGHVQMKYSPGAIEEVDTGGSDHLRVDDDIEKVTSSGQDNDDAAPASAEKTAPASSTQSESTDLIETTGVERSSGAAVSPHAQNSGSSHWIETVDRIKEEPSSTVYTVGPVKPVVNSTKPPSPPRKTDKTEPRLSPRSSTRTSPRKHDRAVSESPNE